MRSNGPRYPEAVTVITHTSGPIARSSDEPQASWGAPLQRAGASRRRRQGRTRPGRAARLRDEVRPAARSAGRDRAGAAMIAGGVTSGMRSGVRVGLIGHPPNQRHSQTEHQDARHDQGEDRPRELGTGDAVVGGDCREDARRQSPWELRQSKARTVFSIAPGRESRAGRRGCAPPPGAARVGRRAESIGVRSGTSGRSARRRTT